MFIIVKYNGEKEIVNTDKICMVQPFSGGVQIYFDFDGDNYTYADVDLDEFYKMIQPEIVTSELKVIDCCQINWHPQEPIIHSQSDIERVASGGLVDCDQPYKINEAL